MYQDYWIYMTPLKHLLLFFSQRWHSEASLCPGKGLHLGHGYIAWNFGDCRVTCNGCFVRPSEKKAPAAGLYFNCAHFSSWCLSAAHIAEVLPTCLYYGFDLYNLLC